MLAICIGKHFGISQNNIKTAIEKYTPTNNRSQIIETKNNTLILDAYNANPSSMSSMLHSFAKQNYHFEDFLEQDLNYKFPFLKAIRNIYSQGKTEQ